MALLLLLLLLLLVVVVVLLLLLLLLPPLLLLLVVVVVLVQSASCFNEEQLPADAGPQRGRPVRACGDGFLALPAGIDMVFAVPWG